MRKPRKPQYVVWIEIPGTRGFQFRKYLGKNGSGKAKFHSKFFSASMRGGKKNARRAANRYKNEVLGVLKKGMTEDELLLALEGQAQGEVLTP